MSNPLGETITIFSGRILFVLSITLNVGKVPSNLEQMNHIEEGDTWWEKMLYSDCIYNYSEYCTSSSYDQNMIWL